MNVDASLGCLQALLDANSYLYKRVCPLVHRSVAFIKIEENNAFVHEYLLQPIKNAKK